MKFARNQQLKTIESKIQNLNSMNVGNWDLQGDILCILIYPKLSVEPVFMYFHNTSEKSQHVYPLQNNFMTERLIFSKLLKWLQTQKECLRGFGV